MYDYILVLSVEIEVKPPSRSGTDQVGSNPPVDEFDKSSIVTVCRYFKIGIYPSESVPLG